MTFYEAALEVLRRSGRPLHFKKITEVAIRDQLLSHVGKAPESTMSSRLDQELKRDGEAWIIMTRPGVFALRSEVLERLNEEAQRREEAKRERLAAVEPEESEAEELVDDEEDVEATSKSSDDRRRRRRRRGRGRSAEAAPAEAEVVEDSEAEEEEAPSRGKRRGRRDSARNGRDKASTEGKNGREAAVAPASNGRGRSRGRDRRREDRPPADLDGARFESIAEAAYAVLKANDRSPLSAAAIAETVFEKKLVRFHTHDPEATVKSAIVTDNQVAVRRGMRPLFAQYRDGWGLTEWGVTDDGVKREAKIQKLADELRQEAVAQLGDAVAELKAEAFEMIAMTLLDRLDYRNLKVSKRTSEGDVFFTADWRRGFSDARVCVHLVADADREIEAEDILNLRDTLEHYSAAEGVLIHLGDVTKDAVRESRKGEGAHVAVIDREAFVRLLVDEGIGVQTYQTPIVMVDTAFIDALTR